MDKIRLLAVDAQNGHLIFFENNGLWFAEPDYYYTPNIKAIGQEDFENALNRLGYVVCDILFEDRAALFNYGYRIFKTATGSGPVSHSQKEIKTFFLNTPDEMMPEVIDALIEQLDSDSEASALSIAQELIANNKIPDTAASKVLQDLVKKKREDYLSGIFSNPAAYNVEHNPVVPCQQAA
jgi:hypothetical protein